MLSNSEVAYFEINEVRECEHSQAPKQHISNKADFSIETEMLGCLF